MKLIPAVAIALAALVAGQTGYAKDCGARPPKLSLPNGATASEDAMKSTQAKFPAYAGAVNTYRKCLVDEAKVAGDEYEQVVSEWKAQQDAFTKTPAK